MTTRWHTFSNILVQGARDGGQMILDDLSESQYLFGVTYNNK